MASIRERVSAGATVHQVLYRHGGKQQSKTFRDRTAAERWVQRIDLDGLDAALEWLRQQDAPRAVGLTVDEVAQKWLEKRAADVASGELTPRVLTGYRRDYENWIKPSRHIGGNRPAASITEGDVQDWVDRMKTMPGSSPKSVGDRHAILHGMFKWAADPRRALVPRNPCIGTELPKKVKKPPKGLRLAELHHLTATARRIDPDAADVIDFIAGTGWRLGETIALTAGQVDDDGTHVYVTMNRVWRREVGYVDDDGKSVASLRRLRVLGPAVAVLRRRVVGKGPVDLVFTTKNGRPWGETWFRRGAFEPIAKAAGFPTSGPGKPTPHWLRHSHVFVCHKAGLDLAEIQRRIGHEDIKMTINTYGRLIDDMDDEAATRLEALLTTPPVAVVSGEVVRGEIG